MNSRQILLLALLTGLGIAGWWIYTHIPHYSLVYHRQGHWIPLGTGWLIFLEAWPFALTGLQLGGSLAFLGITKLYHWADDQDRKAEKHTYQQRITHYQQRAEQAEQQAEQRYQKYYDQLRQREQAAQHIQQQAEEQLQQTEHIQQQARQAVQQAQAKLAKTQKKQKNAEYAYLRVKNKKAPKKRI